VELDRVLGDVEGVGDLAVREVAVDQVQHLALAGGQRRRGADVPGAGALQVERTVHQHGVHRRRAVQRPGDRRERHGVRQVHMAAPAQPALAPAHVAPGAEHGQLEVRVHLPGDRDQGDGGVLLHTPADDQPARVVQGQLAAQRVHLGRAALEPDAGGVGVLEPEHVLPAFPDHEHPLGLGDGVQRACHVLHSSLTPVIRRIWRMSYRVSDRDAARRRVPVWAWEHVANLVGD